MSCTSAGVLKFKFICVYKRGFVQGAHLYKILHVLFCSLLQMLRGISEIYCSA